jgi:D-alanyl-D-alanine carboxypeptidase (penicillin-binding protein 5/6)
MHERRTAARLLAAVLVAAVVVLTGAGAALAGNPRPTVDPSAPTPTSPYPGRPPMGEAPDGSTVGGERLDTRAVVVAAHAPPLPAGIIAPTWLVADAGTGTVLAARDPHGRFYPASTLKTLTLLTLVPVLDPRQVVVGTVEDENIEGTRVGIVAGGRYTVSLLFQAMMLASGNDAANALARAAGGVPRTLDAMNETAETLGAFDTVAGTPSGLDVAGQSSSVYDLALIFRALLELPAAARVLRTPSARMPVVPGRFHSYEIQNKNPLLTSYPGNLGAKNGFTHAARHGFVTAAQRGSRRIIVSVLGSEAVPLRAPDQAARLLDWGFSVPASTDGVGRLIDPAEAAALAALPSSPGHDDATATPSPTVPPSPDVAQPRADVGTGPGTSMSPVVIASLVLLSAGAVLLARRHALVAAASSSSPSPGPALREEGVREEGSREVELPPRPTGGSPSTPP